MKLRNSLKLGLLTAALLLTAVIPAHAQMKCGTDLIDSGDSVLTLLEACGEPTIGDVDNKDDGEWTYNFGPTEFMAWFKNWVFRVPIGEFLPTGA